MSRGNMSSLPAGLLMIMMVLIALLLLPQTFSLENTRRHYCATSCGNQIISHPFRLKGDPPNCGSRWYELSCENNSTVLYLFGGKFFVRQINNSGSTIRVVDAGIFDHQKDNHSTFFPRYFLNHANFSIRLPVYTTFNLNPKASFWRSIELPSQGIVILKCQKAVVNSPSHHVYVNTSTCSDNYGSASSSNSSLIFHSKPYYTYVKVGKTDVMDVEDWCKIEQMSLTSWPERIPSHYISCTDLLNIFLYGFELSWFGSDERRYVFNFVQHLAEIVFTGGSILLICLWHLAITVLGTPFVIAFLIYKWRMRHLSMYDAIENFLQKHNNLMIVRYSFSQLKKMTGNFKEKLGEGGYGMVFKGTLKSGRLVAVKVLGKSKTNGQDFMNEMATIGRIHHFNVVQLVGFCVHGSKFALVYEFMANGSLNKYIFSSEESIVLNYKQTYNIALGVARGIEYLHRGCDMQILHFDIKPHNILLDESFTPKISDFGLAKLYPIEDNTICLTAARGTLGYMAPELFYKNIGGISYKADVYSFGMLLMEMVGKRKNLNAFAEHSSQIYFPTWVYDQFNNGKDIEIRYATEEEKEMTMKMMIVALWCIQMNPSNRPSMNKIVEMLEGEVEHLQIPPKPPLSSPERVTRDCEDNSSQTRTSTQSGELSKGEASTQV